MSSSEELINAVNALGAALNYVNQKEATAYNKDMNDKQLRFAQTQLDEGIRQYNTSMLWAEKESKRNQFNLEHQISNLVTDAESNGINPLAVIGSSAGSGSIASAPGGNVAGSFSPNSVNAPQLDTSVLAQMLHDSRERKEDRKVLREELQIKRDELKRQRDKDIMDFTLASESNDIRRQEFSETIRSNLSQESISKLVNQETNRHNLASEIIGKSQVDVSNKELAVKQLAEDRLFMEAVNNYKIAQQRLQQDYSKTNKELVEKYFNDIVTAVTRVITGAMFSHASSASSAVK